jgi:Mrp family chromosome partitioning ATPase
MFDQSFREMLKLLSGEEKPQGEIQPGVIEAAKKAGVLDLLGRDPAVRVALGKDGNAFLYQAVLGSTSLKKLEHLAEILAEKKMPVIGENSGVRSLL